MDGKRDTRPDRPTETLARARNGAIDAHEAIYRAFQKPVRTLARRLCAQRGDRRGPRARRLGRGAARLVV